MILIPTAATPASNVPISTVAYRERVKTEVHLLGTHEAVSDFLDLWTVRHDKLGHEEQVHERWGLRCKGLVHADKLTRGPYLQ